MSTANKGFSALVDLSTQQLFDMMWLGLAAQGWEQSINTGGGCKYRGAGGRACAIGQCIDDDTAEKWEGCGIVYLRCKDYDDQELSMLPPARADFLQDSQEAHDYSHNPPKMEASFRTLATKYKLTIPTSKEVT